jgi:hypothetical protein
MVVPRVPMVVSEPPATQVSAQPSIGIVLLPRPLVSESLYDERALGALADALDVGMVDACRLVSANVRVFDAEPKNADVDILLIPTNPFFQIGKGGYGTQVTLSMDVRIFFAGQKKERGMLVEAVTGPGADRPKRQVKIADKTYGLIGAKVTGSAIERAINKALFTFSVQFAQKLDSRAKRFVKDRALMEQAK